MFVYQLFFPMDFLANTKNYLVRLLAGAVLLGDCQPRVYNTSSGASITAWLYSDGTETVHIQISGDTDGVTMRAGAQIAAVWEAEG